MSRYYNFSYILTFLAMPLSRSSTPSPTPTPLRLNIHLYSRVLGGIRLSKKYLLSQHYVSVLATAEAITQTWCFEAKI